MRVEELRWMAAGALANAAGAEAAGRRSDERAPKLRASGNGTLVAFLAPIALRAGRADRRHWWAYVGAHLAHSRYLIAAARGAQGFSAVSRFGGAAGYTTIAALGATAYAPGGRPARDPRVRKLHRAGEQLLFGLYAFTLAHGYLAKGRRAGVYGPLAALWIVAARRGAARWDASV